MGEGRQKEIIALGCNQKFDPICETSVASTGTTNWPIYITFLMNNLVAEDNNNSLNMGLFWSWQFPKIYEFPQGGTKCGQLFSSHQRKLYAPHSIVWH